MPLTIENQRLKVTIHPKGAELQSVFHKDHQVEYLWDGDPAFWGKHSPILFPIVGTLKEGIYYYREKAYNLGRHGFARDSLFETEMQASDAVSFLLRSNPETRENFPFEFELRIGYQLFGNGLKTSYSVKNPLGGELYFSIGGHPAFKAPLVSGTDYEDYYLEFEKQETAPRWPISKDGLIEKEPRPLLTDTRLLPLSRELFAADALVLKHPVSAAVSLRSAKTEHGLRLDFPGFPFLGLWAAKNADFVCIEPWCGIADSVDSDQEWTTKEGINHLSAGEVFERAWTLTLF
jgi:galactose mutarotase-like enzyme